MKVDPSAHESHEMRVSRLLDDTVVRARTLSGGMIGDVVRIELRHHAPVVAKYGADSRLWLEANMLRQLRDTNIVPVPEIFIAEDDLLVMQELPGDHLGPAAEPDCATLLAALHGVTADAFGFGGPTLNGRVQLESPWTSSWVTFYREYRLRLAMNLATDYARLPDDVRYELERIIDQTDRLLREPERPSLLHGDLWAANVLAEGDRVTGFIDPSACYGDPELELAYIDAFGSFGSGFWNTYNDLRPIDPDFYRLRRHVYALYPLLMHVYYFGDRFLPHLKNAIAAITPHLHRISAQ